MTDKQKILAYISDNDVTLSQLKNASLSQICTVIGRQVSKGSAKTILRGIIQNMQSVEDQIQVQSLKAHAVQWLDNNGFPNAVLKRKPRSRIIEIHLDGIQEVIE